MVIHIFKKNEKKASGGDTETDLLKQKPKGTTKQFGETFVTVI